MAKNTEIGRMRRERQNLRKVKITNNTEKSDMDIYEICVHFQTPTKEGGRETWNLRQTEYYDNNEDALESCRRLRRLLSSLGKQLYWVSDPTGSIVWTSDPEAYKNIFRYELMTRAPEVLPLD